MRKLITTALFILLTTNIFALPPTSAINTKVDVYNPDGLDLKIIHNLNFWKAIETRNVALTDVDKILIILIGGGSEKFVYKLVITTKDGINHDFKIAVFQDNNDLLDVEEVALWFPVDHQYMKENNFFNMCVEYFYIDGIMAVGDYAEIDETNQRLKANIGLTGRILFFFETMNDEMKGWAHNDYLTPGNILLIKGKQKLFDRIKIIDYPITFHGFQVKWSERSLLDFIYEHSRARNFRDVQILVDAFNHHFVQYSIKKQVMVVMTLLKIPTLSTRDTFMRNIKYNRNLLCAI